MLPLGDAVWANRLTNSPLPESTGRSGHLTLTLLDSRVPREPVQYVANRVPLGDHFVRNCHTKFVLERHAELDKIEAVRIQFFNRRAIHDEARREFVAYSVPSFSGPNLDHKPGLAAA